MLILSYEFVYLHKIMANIIGLNKLSNYYRKPDIDGKLELKADKDTLDFA